MIIFTAALIVWYGDRKSVKKGNLSSKYYGSLDRQVKKKRFCIASPGKAFAGEAKKTFFSLAYFHSWQNFFLFSSSAPQSYTGAMTCWKMVYQSIQGSIRAPLVYAKAN